MSSPLRADLGGGPLIFNGFVMVPENVVPLPQDSIVRIQLIGGDKANSIVEYNRTTDIATVLNQLLTHYHAAVESQKPVLISESLKTELSPDLKISSYNIPPEEVLKYKLISNYEIELALPESDATGVSNSSTSNDPSDHMYQCPPDIPKVSQRLYDTKLTSISLPTREFTSTLETGKIYFGSIVFNDKGEILLHKKFPPLIEVLQDPIHNVEDHIQNNFFYIATVLHNWNRLLSEKVLNPSNLATDMLTRYREFKISDDLRIGNVTSIVDKASIKFKQGFFSASLALYSYLDMPTLGYLYPYPIMVSHDIAVILTIQRCTRKDTNIEFLKQSKLSFGKKKDISSVLLGCERFMSILTDYDAILKRNDYVLKPGLYLGVFHTNSTAKSTRVLVQAQVPSLIPLCNVRADSAISPLEIAYLQSMIDGKDEQFLQENRECTRFKQEISASLDHLSGMTRLDLSMKAVFSTNPIYLGEDIAVLLLNDSASQPSDTAKCTKLYDYIDIKMFETLHFSKYTPYDFHCLTYANFKLGPLVIQASVVERLTTIDSTLSIERDRAQNRLRYLHRQATIIQREWMAARWTRRALAKSINKNSAFKPLNVRLREFSEHKTAESAIILDDTNDSDELLSEENSTYTLRMGDQDRLGYTPRSPSDTVYAKNDLHNSNASPVTSSPKKNVV